MYSNRFAAAASAVRAMSPSNARSMNLFPVPSISVQLPVFLDEYQRMPSILQSIKTRLNSEARAGMFVLAGSASYDSSPIGSLQPHRPYGRCRRRMPAR
jgi:hypothetical protein